MNVEKLFPIKGFETKYLISRSGKIWSIRRKKYLKFGLSTTGYWRVSLGRKNQRSVHRLLALNFIPNPKHKPEINHINGIKKDNTLSNLEWVTDSEQRFHAYRTGLQKPPKWTKERRERVSKQFKGIKLSNQHKINVSIGLARFFDKNKRIKKIKKFISKGLRQIDIAKKMGVSKEMIFYHYKKTEEPFDRYIIQRQIKEFMKQGLRPIEIAKKLNISLSLICYHRKKLDCA